MSVLFEVWRRTVSESVVMRYDQIRRNIKTLRDEGLIPNDIEKAADVGFGSGAGSVALAELFHQAIVTAIDNASSQQNDHDYHRRKLPKWTSRLEIVLDDVREVAPKIGYHDLVLVSRPNMANPQRSATWEEDSMFMARNFIALAEMTKPQSGVALVGYNPHEDPGALWELAKRVDTGKLFNDLKRYRVEHGDEWLILSQVNKKALEEAKLNPKAILTSIGKKEPSWVELRELWRNADGS